MVPRQGKNGSKAGEECFHDRGRIAPRHWKNGMGRVVPRQGKGSSKVGEEWLPGIGRMVSEE